MFIKIFTEDKDNAFPLPKNMLFSLGPLINQLQLLSWLGTDFMEIPLKNHLERLLQERKPSNYELCLVDFIYSDLKFAHYIDYMKKTIKRIDRPFFAETFMMKVFLMYIFRSPSSSVLDEYEKIMKDLLIKSRKIPRKKADGLILRVFRKIKKEEDATK